MIPPTVADLVGRMQRGTTASFMIEGEASSTLRNHFERRG
jgi:hypothetical protein